MQQSFFFNSHQNKYSSREETITIPNSIHFRVNRAASIVLFSCLESAHWKFRHFKADPQRGSVSNAFQALKLVAEERKVMKMASKKMERVTKMMGVLCDVLQPEIWQVNQNHMARYVFNFLGLHCFLAGHLWLSLKRLSSLIFMIHTWLKEEVSFFSLCIISNHCFHTLIRKINSKQQKCNVRWEHMQAAGCRYMDHESAIAHGSRELGPS